MYDYIIVGAGSAGCVLAARLTEDADTTVLLIEAGGWDTDPYIHMPVGFFKMTEGDQIWGYNTVPQKNCNNRQIPMIQARVIGGGSSINAEVFTRGAPQDYDRWANDEGCPGWSYDEIKPYFIKSEGNDTLGAPHHGATGPLGVSTLDAQPMTRVFVQACQQFGIPHTSDFNGPEQAGCGVYQITTKDAKRCSAAVGYLNPAKPRPNLTIETDCQVNRIVVEDGTAIGVDYIKGGQTIAARASREVLLTAGAIGSPKLMMLSGLGPADHLREHGLEVVADIPGVGANLHDHFDIDIVYELKGPWSFDKYRKWYWKLMAGLQYKLFKSGPVASNIVEGGAFWWTNRDEPTPDTQYHFLVGAGVEAGVAPPSSGSGVTVNFYYLRPRSRGTVRLASASPSDSPLIDPNYADDPYDLKMTVEAIKLGRELMRQPIFDDYIEREHFPGEDVSSDADIGEYAKNHGRTSYHPVGTCKMGQDDMAVVGPDLRVHGIKSLRICDSSVMPSIVSSNTNAPTIMIAEKASDLIRGL